MAMATADRRSQQAGIRFTSARRRAFELLVRAGGPVKAYDLLAGFSLDHPTAPITVYRALDALIAMGLAHRIASLNAFVWCSRSTLHHATAFLICDCCV